MRSQNQALGLPAVAHGKLRNTHLEKEAESRHGREFSGVIEHLAQQKPGFLCTCRSSAVRAAPEKSGSGDTLKIKRLPEGAWHFRRLELIQLLCIPSHHPNG